MRAQQPASQTIDAELVKMRHWAADASRMLIGKPSTEEIARARNGINRVYKALLRLTDERDGGTAGHA